MFGITGKKKSIHVKSSFVSDDLNFLLMPSFRNVSPMTRDSSTEALAPNDKILKLKIKIRYSKQKNFPSCSKVHESQLHFVNTIYIYQFILFS